MLGRSFSFVLFLALGWGLGWVLAEPPAVAQGAAWGLLGGAVTWYAIDLWRANRVADWLTAPDQSLPTTWGVWGDVVDRVRRLTRSHDRQLHTSRASLEQFLSAIQASPNGVLMLDREWRITWCNSMAAQHLGIDPARDMAQLIGNLVRNPDFNRYLQHNDHSEPVIIDGREHRPEVPQRLALQLFAYGQEQHLLLTQDITSVEQSEAMRRDFVANVSHEIRTPLTVLAGFIETLQTLQLDADEQHRYLALMAKQASRMQSLVEDLLTLSKLEERQHRDQGEWISLQGLIQSAMDEAVSLTQKMNPPPASPHPIECLDIDLVQGIDIRGTPTELLSAFSNLLSNAVRHTPAGSPIQVSWVMKEGEGVFTVQDKGPGIPPEHLPRLAQRFYRIDRSRSRETGGTGLGLAIVKHIMQRHQGRMLVESRLNEGSQFSLVFPIERLRHPEAQNKAHVTTQNVD